MAIGTDVIAGCKKGSKEAVKAFYQDCSPWMLGVAIRYVRDRNEAMSLVNISVLTAIEKIGKFDESREQKIEAWLKKILVRKVMDYKRKNRTDEEVVNIADHASYRITATSENGEGTRKAALQRIVDSLPDRTRTVFNLYAIEGYSHKEIAGLLKIAEGTSKWHLSEARTQLKKMLIAMDDYRIIEIV